jgi:hypothetical protein
MAANNMTAGKAKKSGAPRKAPKVKAPNPKKPNFMREADVIQKRKNPQQPMTAKRLSK